MIMHRLPLLVLIVLLASMKHRLVIAAPASLKGGLELEDHEMLSALREAVQRDGEGLANNLDKRTAGSVEDSYGGSLPYFKRGFLNGRYPGVQISMSFEELMRLLNTLTRINK